MVRVTRGSGWAWQKMLHYLLFPSDRITHSSAWRERNLLLCLQHCKHLHHLKGQPKSPFRETSQIFLKSKTNLIFFSTIKLFHVVQENFCRKLFFMILIFKKTKNLVCRIIYCICYTVFKCSCEISFGV